MIKSLSLSKQMTGFYMKCNTGLKQVKRIIFGQSQRLGPKVIQITSYLSCTNEILNFFNKQLIQETCHAFSWSTICYKVFVKVMETVIRSFCCYPLKYSWVRVFVLFFINYAQKGSQRSRRFILFTLV